MLSKAKGSLFREFRCGLMLPLILIFALFCPHGVAFATGMPVAPPDVTKALYPGSSDEPGTLIDSLTPTLHWTHEPQAEFYALTISRHPYGPDNIVYNYQSLTDTSHAVPAGILEVGQHYRWNVLAGNRAGRGPVSNNLFFQTEPLLTTLAITGLTPSAISTNTAPFNATLSVAGSGFNNVVSVEFNWSGAASGSDIWSRGDSRWNSGVRLHSDATMTLLPRVVEHRPVWSGMVHWTATLRDDRGATASMPFTVTYTAPRPSPQEQSPPGQSPGHISPSSRATGVSITPAFSWNVVRGAARYALQVTDARTGAVVFDSRARGINIAGTSYALPSGLLRGGVTYRWSVRAGNAAGWGPASTAWTFTVAPLNVTAAPQAGSVGAAYRTSLTASGGRAPYRWSVVSGNLPQGLSISRDGIISGTPAVAGTSRFTVRARDSGNPARTADRAMSITVNPAGIVWQWPRNEPRRGQQYNNYRTDIRGHHTGVDVFGTDNEVLAVANGEIVGIFRPVSPPPDPWSTVSVFAFTNYEYLHLGKDPLKFNGNQISGHKMQGVVIVRHTLPNNESIYSLYAHLRSVPNLLEVGQHVSRGDVIGYVIPQPNSKFHHVHLEIKNKPYRHNPASTPIRWGYTPKNRHPDEFGYKNPTVFFRNNKGIKAWQ